MLLIEKKFQLTIQVVRLVRAKLISKWTQFYVTHKTDSMSFDWEKKAAILPENPVPFGVCFFSHRSFERINCANVNTIAPDVGSTRITYQLTLGSLFNTATSRCFQVTVLKFVSLIEDCCLHLATTCFIRNERVPLFLSQFKTKSKIFFVDKLCQFDVFFVVVKCEGTSSVEVNFDGQ